MAKPEAQEQGRLVGRQGSDVADLIESLSDEQLDTPSLCEGWRVRDVVGHLCVGIDTTLPQVLASVARHGGNVAKASYDDAIAYASTHSAAQMASTIRAFSRGYPEGEGRDGILRVVPPRDLQVDTLIHTQDIRRPLGLGDGVPEERLATALRSAPSIAGLMKLKQRAKGLRLRATDLDLLVGSNDGPTVEGPAEALLLALSGRSAGLGELDGDGVGSLAARCP